VVVNGRADPEVLLSLLFSLLSQLFDGWLLS